VRERVDLRVVLADAYPVEKYQQDPVRPRCLYRRLRTRSAARSIRFADGVRLPEKKSTITELLPRMSNRARIMRTKNNAQSTPSPSILEAIASS
jgi:hypothetical protein